MASQDVGQWSRRQEEGSEDSKRIVSRIVLLSVRCSSPEKEADARERLVRWLVSRPCFQIGQNCSALGQVLKVQGM